MSSKHPPANVLVTHDPWNGKMGRFWGIAAGLLVLCTVFVMSDMREAAARYTQGCLQHPSRKDCQQMELQASPSNSSSEPLTPTPLIAQPPSYLLRVVTSHELNVRSGPGVENGVIGKLQQGQQVELIEESSSADGGRWGHISSEGMRGWVNMKHLESAP